MTDWYKQNRLAEDEELPPDLFTDEEVIPYAPEPVKRAPKPKNNRAPITEKQRAPSLFIGVEEASCERAPITEVVGANLELTTIKHGLGSKIDSYYSITGVKLSESQDKVYKGYYELGALTDPEMQEAIGMDKNLVNARRNDLMKKGLVEFAFKKYNPKTGIDNNAYRLKGN